MPIRRFVNSALCTHLICRMRMAYIPDQYDFGISFRMEMKHYRTFIVLFFYIFKDNELLAA